MAKLGKQEAVKQALKHFGKDAKPKQMQPWIKSELGIDMTTDHISNAKSVILTSARKRPVPKTAAAAAQKTGPKRVATTPVPRKTTAIPLEDILYLKALVRRVEP